MCLEKAKGPYIARKDIVVYKVFDKSSLSPTKLMSYFKSTFWPKEGLTTELSFFGGEVERGLHAFCDRKPAISMAGKNRNTSVRMCVIPKGSTYYRGIFRSSKSIAADRMVIKQYYKPKKK